MVEPVRQRRQVRITFDVGLVLTFLLALFAVWPLLSPGLPNTADGPIHFYRAVDMQQAWRDGVLYPRWSSNLALGYGTPLFNFAPPLIYLLMMLLNVLGADLALAMKWVVILFIFISAEGAYLLGKDVLGRHAGLVTAAAYLYAPYRLRELYIQGNYAQFLALALYPLVLWCYFKVIHTGRLRYIIGGGFAYAAVFLSHNISVMIFSPLLAAYVVFWLILRRSWTAVRDACITGVLGLGLSAIFWLPAFYEQRWLQISQITKGHFDYRLHFLSLREVFAPYMALDYSAVNVYLPLSLGLAAVTLGALAFIGAAWPWHNVPGDPAHVSNGAGVSPRKLVLFSTLLLSVSVFMMLPPSAFLWEHLPLLKLTEFPWRWLGVAAVPLSLLAGGSVYFLQRLLPARMGKLVPAAALLCLLIPSFFYLFPRKPFVDLSHAEVKDITAYELRTKAFGTTSAGEFLPMWTLEHPTDSPMVADYEAGRPIDKIDRTSLPHGAEVEETGRGYLWVEYIFESELPFRVRFNTLWFPGWQVYVDGARTSSDASSPKGLVEANIPAGRHEVKLSFETTLVRSLANGLSALTLLLCLGLAVSSRHWPAPPDGKKAVGGKPPERRSALGGESSLRWTFSSLLWCGGAILLLLIVKEALIGPYLGWFRLQSPPGQVIGVQHPAHIRLADQAVFLGYDLDRATVSGGDTVTIRTYWQAQPAIRADYSSFVHLDSLPDWVTVAQSDAVHPGGIPMTTWPPSFYAWDEHRIHIPTDLPPGMYVLRAGLYDRQTGQRLSALDERSQLGDSNISLQGLRVQSARPLQTKQLAIRPQVRLNGIIRLVSYDVVPQPASLAPGMPFTATLYWQTAEPVHSDYTVFLHLLDAKGEIVAQMDGPPAAGRYPISYWLPGEIVADERQLVTPADSEGPYRLVVGLYDPVTLNRLEMMDSKGSLLPENQMVLE